MSVFFTFRMMLGFFRTTHGKFNLCCLLLETKKKAAVVFTDKIIFITYSLFILLLFKLSL